MFPYAPKGHVSIVQVPIKANQTFVVSIHFRFGQDEETIEIGFFGHYVLKGNGDHDDLEFPP